MLVVGDRTPCRRADPGVVVYDGSYGSVGPLLFAGILKAGVADVYYFARNKRERGQYLDPRGKWLV